MTVSRSLSILATILSLIGCGGSPYYVGSSTARFAGTGATPVPPTIVRAPGAEGGAPLRSVAVLWPDGCTSSSYGAASGTAPAAAPLIAMDCGVLMESVEVALNSAGFRVVSWDALRRRALVGDLSPEQAAEALGVQGLIRIVTLETSEVVDSVEFDRTLHRADRQGHPLGAPLDPTRAAAASVFPQLEQGIAGVVRRSVTLVAVVSLIPLWGVYRGLAPAGPAPEAKAHFESLLSYQSGRSPVVKLVSALPFPLEWRAGYASLDYSSVGRPASLAGQAWTVGRWWYFPVAAALKLPATLLIAVGVGWLLALRRAARRRLLVVSTLSPALGLWLVLVVQTMNLGLRLVLPSIALAMVGVGALAEPVRSSLRALPRTFPVPRSMERRAWSALGTVVAVMVVATVQLGSMVLSAPHSLAWSPWPATPPYRWVSDSNVDVGQAVFEVRDWVADHDHPYVAIDATRGLSVGGSSRQLLGADPAAIKGWVAVGVTTIRDTRRRELAWLRAYCPVGSIGGGSVLVYRFDRPPGPAPGPDRPAAPCFGDRWSTRG